MTKESYVPISEVNSSVIKVELTLPFGIEGKLGINVRKVETLCQIAGLRYLVIENEKNPDHSQIVPLIVGVDSQGTAVSGGAKITKVPTFMGNCKEVDNYGENGVPFPLSINKRNRWGELKISINAEEIKGRFLQGNKVIRCPNLWAEEIDAAVRQGIVGAGMRFLLSLPTYGDKFYTLFTNCCTLSTSALSGNLINFVECYLASAVFTNALYAIVFGIEKKGEGSRVTLIYGPEIDRAIALYFTSLGKPLIKELNSPQGS